MNIYLITFKDKKGNPHVDWYVCASEDEALNCFNSYWIDNSFDEDIPLAYEVIKFENDDVDGYSLKLTKN